MPIAGTVRIMLSQKNPLVSRIFERKQKLKKAVTQTKATPMSQSSDEAVKSDTRDNQSKSGRPPWISDDGSKLSHIKQSSRSTDVSDPFELETEHFVIGELTMSQNSVSGSTTVVVIMPLLKLPFETFVLSR